MLVLIFSFIEEPWSLVLWTTHISISCKKMNYASVIRPFLLNDSVLIMVLNISSTTLKLPERLFSPPHVGGGMRGALAKKLCCSAFLFCQHCESITHAVPAWFWKIHFDTWQKFAWKVGRWGVLIRGTPHPLPLLMAAPPDINWRVEGHRHFHTSLIACFSHFGNTGL